MKQAFDFVQVMFGISDPSIRFIGIALVFLAVWILLKTVSAAAEWIWKALKKCLPAPSIINAFLLVAMTFVGWINSQAIHDGTQFIEQYWFDPVYIWQSSLADPDIREAMYEIKFKQNFRADEGWKFNVLKKRTKALADSIGTTTLAIYEMADLECHGDPFNIRSDQVAAGWIQFTDAGCKGLNFTKLQVIDACKKRDINFIMDATDAYMIRKFRRLKKGTTLADGIDLYLAVFAPAFIGKGPEVVVYQGYDNPAYYKNSGLDGWYLLGNKIMQSDSRKDGKICVGEIFLALENRKAKMVRNMNRGVAVLQ